MSRSGCAPGQLPYVTVLDAVAAQVEPLGCLAPSGSGGTGTAMVDVRSEPPPPGRQGQRGQQQQQQQRRRQQQQQGQQGQRGGRSCWNVDGEILRSPAVCVEAHHGLLQVFSRGVEQ